MFTIDTLLRSRRLEAWSNPDGGAPARMFYFPPGWRATVIALDDVGDDDGRKPAGRLSNEPSMRANVEGLVGRFVAGDPKSTLVGKSVGGIHPVFKRLDHPRSVIVEMRTRHTRSFGFFVRRNVFVAVNIKLKANLKTTPDGRKAVRGSEEDPYVVASRPVIRFIELRMAPSEVDRETDVDDLISDGPRTG